MEIFTKGLILICNKNIFQSRNAPGAHDGSGWQVCG